MSDTHAPFPGEPTTGRLLGLNYDEVCTLIQDAVYGYDPRTERVSPSHEVCGVEDGVDKLWELLPQADRQRIMLDAGWLNHMINRFADGTLEAGAIVAEIAATVAPLPDRPAPPGADTGAVLVARCENLLDEWSDDGQPCTGEIRFRWGQAQSEPCSECGGRCGIAVAAWDRVERG